MGLFTNRKHEDADTEMVASATAIGGFAPFFDEVEPLNDTADQPVSEVDATSNFFDNSSSFGKHQSEFAAQAATPDFLAAPESAVAPDYTVPEVARPFTGGDHDATSDTAPTDFDLLFEEVEPETPPAPRRMLEDQPEPKVETGNVEIDVDGLLQMLGVSADASLIDISEARLRFLAEHDPSSETNEDAARIKERICREVNTAYASFRLTRGI